MHLRLVRSNNEPLRDSEERTHELLRQLGEDTATMPVGRLMRRYNGLLKLSEDEMGVIEGRESIHDGVRDIVEAARKIALPVPAPTDSGPAAPRKRLQAV